MLKVVRDFVGHGYNFPPVGQLINPAEPARSALLEAGVVEEHEVKVVAPPAEIKKNARSASSRRGRAAKKTTRKRSKKSATKSS